MATPVAINGFGRIGRLIFRAAVERNADVDFLAVNDIAPPKTLAYLLRYDSVHGRFNGTIETTGDEIIVNGKRLRILTQKDISQLPWKELGVHLVVEATGLFTDRASASKHIQAGAKKVLISAPAENPDATIVVGVNEKQYDSEKHNVVSNASCTTNCLAPVAKVLNDSFGIKYGLMTTTHAYTNDQRIQDLVHKDLRRARAAALNMIPTSTGAAKAIGLVLPELNGRLNGIALRVPVADVSIVDLTVELNSDVTKEEVNAAFSKACGDSLKGILEYTEDPIVSSDVLHTSVSGIVDGQATMVLGDKGKLVKVLAWYDNEWGFSSRMVDLIELMGRKAGF